MFYQDLNLDQFTISLVSHYDTKHYSLNAIEAIYEYYEKEFIELDPVAIACEWKEYPSLASVLEDYLASVLEDYGYLRDKYWDERDWEGPGLIEFLESEVTEVLHLDNGGYLIQAF